MNIFSKLSRRFGVAVLVMAAGAFSLRAQSSAPAWEIKLAGGMIYADLAGLNGHMSTDIHWSMDKGGWANAHWGIDLAGEINLRLNSRFGIALGSGFMQVGQSTADGEFIGPDNASYNHAVRVRVVPVFVNLVYSMPLGRGLRLTASAGPGIYFGYFSHTYTAEWISGTHAIEYKTSGMELGGQAAVGLSLAGGPRFAVFIEAQGRYVRFSDMMKKIDICVDGEKNALGTRFSFSTDLSGLGVRAGVSLAL